MSVDILLNAGSVDISNLLLAGFAANVSDSPQVVAQYPTLDVEGEHLHVDLVVSDMIVNTDSIDVPGVGEESASGGGTIDIGTGGTVEAGGSVQADIVDVYKRQR